MENCDRCCFTKPQSIYETETGCFMSSLAPKQAPKPVLVRMPTDRDATHYKMDHEKRGRAIILNHENFGLNLPKRDGTNNDADTMAWCLMKLGFDVTVYRESRYAALMQHVKDAVKFDHTDYDCIVMVVLSHGDDGNQLYAYDKLYDFNDLWTPFSADSCTTLAGKPKLFFVQACGFVQAGGNFIATSQAPVMLHNGETNCPTCYSIPAAADFLFVFSNIPDTGRGSWFIESLCKELIDKSYKYEFEQILTFVKRKIAFGYESNVPNVPTMDKIKQIPAGDSRLTRLLQFTRKSNKSKNADCGQQYQDLIEQWLSSRSPVTGRSQFWSIAECE